MSAMTGPGAPSPNDRPRSTVLAVIAAAVEATAATAGWILETRDGELTIVAAHGGSPAWSGSLVGRRARAGVGTAALVVQSGQPVALQPGRGSLGDELGTELLQRSPVSLVCVPCLDGEAVVGALQLVDKGGGGPFDFDDVELATLLGTIAGPALREAAAADRPGRAGPGTPAPTPEGLGRDLARLAEADPVRFATAARVVEALLA
jgi:GAF domain-containing protein